MTVAPFEVNRMTRWSLDRGVVSDR